MKTKLWFRLLLLIIFPMALLVLASGYLLKQETLTREHQIQSLVQAQLQAVEINLLQYPINLEQKFMRDVQRLTAEKMALRDYVRKTPEIRQVLVMSAEGRRLFPPMGDKLLPHESEFLERTTDIWKDKTILYQLYDDKMTADVAVSQETAPKKIKFPSASSLESKAPAAEIVMTHGWYTWFWGKEMNLLFWVKSDQGELFGFELEPMRMLAQMISLLPDTTQDQTDFRIQLGDARGNILYQWGQQYIDEQQSPIAIYPLDHPLGAWKLNYFSKNLTVSSILTWWNILLLLAIVFLVLTGLAISIYREHTREDRLAKQRVNFVNQVSHELKTPLTNIRLYAELLSDEMENQTTIDEQNTKPKQFLSVISQEAQRLSRLIHNVLDFARVEKKTLTVKPRLCDMNVLVETVLAAHQPSFSAKNITINFSTQLNDHVVIDPDIVEQILNNLLSNVEKYGFSGGQVDVSVYRDFDKIVMTVHDHGPGIAKSDREKIFQPFYRASSKLTDGVAGTGIGLDISRSLAKLHGGDLVLRSTVQGACFDLTLKG